MPFFASSMGPLKILLRAALYLLTLVTVPLLALALVPPEGAVGVVVAAMALVAVGFALLKPTLNLIAKARLGQVHAALGGEAVRRGAQIPCTVRIPLARGGEVEHVVFGIKAVEKVTSGTGTDSRTYSEILHEDSIVVRAPVRSERALEFVGRLDIPEHAPPSFKAPDNAVTWSVEVRVALRGWPDWAAGGDFRVLV